MWYILQLMSEKIININEYKNSIIISYFAICFLSKLWLHVFKINKKYLDINIHKYACKCTYKSQCYWMLGMFGMFKECFRNVQIHLSQIKILACMEHVRLF